MHILARPLCQPVGGRTFLAGGATWGYIAAMTTVGIRELKNNLSRYLRRVQAGERIAVTERGRIVAELRPPELEQKPRDRLDELIASGRARPPLNPGPLPEGWPNSG